MILENPLWAALEPHVRESSYPWSRGHLEVPLTPENGDWSTIPDRDRLVRQYSWTVTDPATVEFVALHGGAEVVDPMAGTGYWAYLLGQLGVDVASYDLAGATGTNTWVGEHRWTSVTEADGAEAVAAHPERTLLLSWPPYSTDAGERIIRAYEGRRIVYIGEAEGGCTGDDGMHRLLELEWVEMARHRPVQWFGVHDDVTVFNRRT